MLVLARKVGEEIVLDDGEKVVFLKLCEMKEDYANLGITAPSVVKVFRKEIYLKKINSNQ